MATTELVTVEGKSVTIGDEQYSITKIPDASSKLVKDTRARVLGELNFDDFLRDLSLVGQFLYVAYNGVATVPTLSGQVSTLQVNYSKLCSDSQSTMNSFQTCCEKMLEHLENLFGYLLDGEEDTALLYIGKMAKVADRMALDATSLKEAFDGLFLQATEALAGAETAKGSEEEKQAALEKERENFEALTAKALVLKEEIAKSKEKLQQLYEEAKAAAEKHENRAFGLAIVGAIMKPLGEGLGAFAGAMASSKIPISLPTTPPATPPKESDDPAPSKPSAEEVKAREEAETKRTEAEEEVKKTKEEAEKAEEKAKAAEKVAEEAEEKAAEAQEKLEKAEDEDLVEAREEAETAKAEAETAEEEAAEAKKAAEAAQAAADKAAEKYRLLTAAMAGLGKGLSSAGDAAMDMGKSYAEIAANYNKEKQEYLKMLLDEQKEERKALADIAEYAKRIQNIGKYVDLTKIVVEALFQAVGALKQIVVILTNAAELWKRMASHCSQLSDSSGTLKDVIGLWQTKPQQERIKMYLSSRFITQGVRYYADWKALEIISKEYGLAAQKIKGEVQANVRENVPTEQKLKIAITKGKELLQKTTTDIKALDNEAKAINAELKATNELTSAQNA